MSEGWGSAADRQALDNWITREPDDDEVVDTTPPVQFLAWGGESEGFTVVTVEQIAKDVTSDHYSGSRMWTDLAYIDHGPPSWETSLGAPPSLRRVTLVSRRGERVVDEDDIIHQGYDLCTDGGTVVASFSTEIDGRA